MKKLYWAIIPLIILVNSCAKEEKFSLNTSGNYLSTADFSYTLSSSPGGDTLPFVNKVVFTNKSKDSHVSQWNFGDNSPLNTDDNPVHYYTNSGNFTVKLITLGTAGSNSTTQSITLGSSCDFAPFNNLTSCGSRSWKLSPSNDAIRVLSSDTMTVLYPGGNVPSCQGDDSYTFYSNGKFEYDSKGSTFVANEQPQPYSCQSSKINADTFFMLKNLGGRPKIVLRHKKGSNRSPFIGVTDSVVNNTYEVLSVTNDNLELQGRFVDNTVVRLKLVNGTPSLSTIKNYLTGGGRKTWRLDTTAGASATTAGLEANPTQYYAGGPLNTCQKDDWYTFTTGDSIIYNANGATQRGSAPYDCFADKSFGTKYTFGIVTDGASGTAQINLPSAVSVNNDLFIGVMDRSKENVYRILYIDNEKMTLRVGNGLISNTSGGLVHTLKLVVNQ